MSAVPLTVDEHASSGVRWRNRPALRVWAILGPGVLLGAALMVLLILVQRAGVTSSGHPDATGVLLRLGSALCLLVPGRSYSRTCRATRLRGSCAWRDSASL